MTNQVKTTQIAENKELTLQEKVVLASKTLDLTENEVLKLIEATNQIGGCSFVSISGYSSDKSGQTEIANHVVNIGASYGNMKEKSKVLFSDINYNDTEIIVELMALIQSHNYSKYAVNHIAIIKNELISLVNLLANSGTKEQINENLFFIALNELCNPTTRETNDIWLNKAFVFNTKTARASIFGQSINKVVEVKGEFKVVNSAPKTIIKNILTEYTKPTKSLLRRFAIDNLKAVKISGDTLYFG